MSIAEQITRINSEKKRIATKTTEFGLTDNDTVSLKTLADAIEGIQYHDCVDVTITQDGDPFEIVPGYHKGGFIYAVDNPEADKPKYLLESGRVVTPLKNTDQTIVKGEGYYGLGAVVVKKIPDAYQDVTQVDAKDYEVLATKKIVAKDGTVVVGTMPNNGEWGIVLDLSKTQEQIPQGYHDGEGIVAISLEVAKKVTPTKELQSIAPAPGKMLSVVMVEPIPHPYHDVSVVDAKDTDVLWGKKFVDAEGNEKTGKMSRRNVGTVTLDTTYEFGIGGTSGYSNYKYDIPEGYHGGNETVMIQIDDTKEITPSKSVQFVSADAGWVLGTVKIDKIPDIYQDISKQSLTAFDVLETATFVGYDGKLENGLIKKYESIDVTIDGLTNTEYSNGVSGYYPSVKVKLSNDIETALAAI